MKKLGVLALTMGAMLVAAAPSQATVKLTPDSVPMAALQGGPPVKADVTLTISADESNRNLVSWSVTGSTGPYSVSKTCPDVFPPATEESCAIGVTLNPNAPGVTSGLFPVTLKTVLTNGIETAEATALINGIITPVAPPIKPPKTSPDRPSIKDRVREAHERARGKGKDKGTPTAGAKGNGKGKCGKKKGRGKAKGKASASAKKGKKKCGGKKKPKK